MTEQATIDLAVAEGDDEHGSVPEALGEDAPEKTPENECSTFISAIEDSGRIMFREADMLFLKINGIQMFTFYEIMGKLCPGTKRGTVGNRFTRLKATKHACNKAEIKLVKELGGTNPTFYNCTLVARADVERYCEKYEGNNGARLNGNTCSSKPDNEKSKKRTTNQGLKEIDTVVTGQQVKKDKTSFSKGNARKKSTSKSILPEAKSLNITKIQVDKNSLQLSTVDTNTSITKQNMQDAGKKRKRRTQFELLQSYEFYTDITEDENHKRKKTSVSDGDDQQLKDDSIMSVDINSNIIDGQNISPTKLQEATFDYDKLHLSYSDDDNNASSSVEPRSPTLLLKRSQNNKWHVAKAVVPLLSFDDTETEKISDMVIKTKSSKNPGESKPAMTRVKNKLKSPRKSSNTTSKEPSGEKTKMDESVRPLTSVKKIVKKGLKKVNKSNKNGKSSATALDEKEKTTKLEENPISDKDITDAKPENSDTSVSVQHKNLDGRKSSPLLKDSTDSLNTTSILNKEKRESTTKNDSKGVKKKRRRRVDMNNFRLIETIPYPSLLVVKDGDLCPSYTMAYNEKNYLPGCCHALWRWRLGKPVKIPSQSPVKTKDDPSLDKTNENFMFPLKTKQDEHSQFERSVGWSDEQFQIEKMPDKQSQVEIIPDEQSQVEIIPDEQSQVKRRSSEQSPVENMPDKQSPVERRPDEQQPQVERRPDEQSHVERRPDEQSHVERRPDGQSQVIKMPDEQSLIERRPDGQSQIKKMTDEQSLVESRPHEQSPVVKIPDEQFQVEKMPDEKPQVKKLPDEKSLNKIRKDEEFVLEIKLSPVEAKRAEHSAAKEEKHVELSPSKTTQDEQARDDVKSDENKELSKLRDDDI